MKDQDLCKIRIERKFPYLFLYFVSLICIVIFFLLVIHAGKKMQLKKSHHFPISPINSPKPKYIHIQNRVKNGVKPRNVWYFS